MWADLSSDATGERPTADCAPRVGKAMWRWRNRSHPPFPVLLPVAMSRPFWQGVIGVCEHESGDAVRGVNIAMCRSLFSVMMGPP